MLDRDVKPDVKQDANKDVHMRQATKQQGKMRGKCLLLPPSSIGLNPGSNRFAFSAGT
jgi:hypothetical protein